MRISASAPGKLILMGEHAVVYGEPGLVLPLRQLRAVVTLTAAPQPRLEAPDLNLFTDLSTGIAAMGPDVSTQSLHPLEVTLLKAQHHLHTHHNLPQQLPNLCFHIRSDIPVKRGMGSGTAISCACIRALAAYYHCRLNVAEVEAFAQAMDQIYHGRPSGIDAAVIAHERALRFQRDPKGAPVVRFLDVPHLALLIGDTGPAAPTADVVAHVARRHARDPRIAEVIQRMGALVRSAEQALRNQQWQVLGQLLFENHQCLQALEVSTPTLDHLITQAEALGVAGAKLSGAGQGGICFALFDAENPNVDAQVKALRQAWKPVCTQLYDFSAALSDAD